MHASYRHLANMNTLESMWQLDLIWAQVLPFAATSVQQFA